MRIGTWNLNARWTRRHAAIIHTAACDVWLLTEVLDRVTVPGCEIHRSTARMSPGQYYAGVMSRLPMTPQPSPHPATAAVQIEGRTFCSSVLPWASKDDPAVWGPGNQGQRTRRAVESVAELLTPDHSVWGGDFNHALAGPTQYSGSIDGRAAILEAVESLGLTVPTAPLENRRPGIRSIDHIAVPRTWAIQDASRITTPAALSDHDAYVATCTSTTETISHLEIAQ